MTSNSPDKELDALKADIAGLREEIAGLAAGMKKSSGVHAEQSQAAASPGGTDPGQEGRHAWEDLMHKFESSKVQGEKVVRDLAAEVERHPLVSIMAAFGLGYLIAKLWYQEKKP